MCAACFAGEQCINSDLGQRQQPHIRCVVCREIEHHPYSNQDADMTANMTKLPNEGTFDVEVDPSLLDGSSGDAFFVRCKELFDNGDAESP